MKKIKYLLSIMIIIVVMSTTAYAADETTTSHKDNEMSELDKIYKDYLNSDGSDRSELDKALEDFFSNIGKEVTTSKKDENKNTLIIPADNKYFPNMTLTEIKQWYVNEVNKHIATGIVIQYQALTTLEKYQNAANKWAEDIIKGKEKFIEWDERVYIETYNTPETQEFYKVQKKLYDFIREYEETNKVILNFEKWDMVEVETTEEKQTTSTIEEETTTLKKEETITTNSEETTSSLKNEEEENGDKDDSDESSLLDVVKKYWFTLLLLVVLVIGGIIFKITFKNKN